jgi:hypothetical protein
MTLILSGTNGVSDVDGDASTPAIRGTDANSGIYFGSDTVGISAGGTQKLLIGTGSATIDGLTVGRGGGAVSTNTAVGASALAANEAGGTNNTAVGYQALDANTTGDQNTAVGDSALGANTTASDNTAVGYQALFSNTTGTGNVALGYKALTATTTQSYNTALGFEAGEANTTGFSNTYVGAFAGELCTTATANSFFGNNSGNKITTGSKNVILGSYDGNQGGLDIRTLSNYIVLSDGDGNPKLRIDGEAGAVTQLALIQQTESTATIASINKATVTGRNRLSIANNTTTNIVSGYFGSIVMITSIGQASPRDFQYTWLVTHGWSTATVLFTNSYGGNTFTVTFTASNGNLQINHNGGANIEFVTTAILQGGFV